MTPHELYDRTLRMIQPVALARIEKAYQRLDSLTKPRRSLGYLEEIAARLVAVLQQANPAQRGTKPKIEGKRVFVFAGDHKVVVEGVSAYPSSVTTLMATGEMGIGNTTPAAALLAILLDLPARDLVGTGTGLDTAVLARKRQIVDQAVTVNRSRCTDPLSTLAALGGLEIAGICGLCLGAAARERPVVVDGFISSAGALVAMRLCPAVKDYLFFAHMSAEQGHRKFFEKECLRPIVSLDMRLGEGTGAAIAMQIIEDALAIYNEMATFEQAGITPGA